MLIPTPQVKNDRLRQVRRELMRGFRWPTRRRRPFAVDPDSKILRHTAMCSRCDWQREFPDKHHANDEAVVHGRKAHGDDFCCFIRVHAR